MKELTTEQKAKAYDEAIKKARSWYVDAQMDFKKSLEALFPELKSEDEKIRQEIIKYIKTGTYHKNWITWLEKQGEHANFRNHIQIGDRVTRNEDGILVNLSQLERVAKQNTLKLGE